MKLLNIAIIFMIGFMMARCTVIYNGEKVYDLRGYNSGKN